MSATSSVTVPETLADALRALSNAPDSTVLAGGTDLMVEFNSGHHRADQIIVVNRIGELCSWHYDPDASTLRLGAGITYTEIEQSPIAGWVPALAQAARTVGSPQIRHAATIGGNLGTCSPAGDGLPVLSALEAQIHLASATAERTLPFAEFMVGPKRTALQPGELITAVTVPVLNGWQGYSKVGVRNAMVIAVASASLVVEGSVEGNVEGNVDPARRGVRLALGSVGPVILRCPEAEALIAAEADFESGSVRPTVVAQFAELARRASRPIDDHRSTAEYRRHAVGVLAARLLRRAFPNE